MRAADVLELALEFGFDLAGIAPLAPPKGAGHFERWLAAGHHADMAWLERQRERILDPRRILPEGKSILVLGAGHAREATRLSDGARVARYATGRDYHNVLGKRLAKLVRRLRQARVIDHSRAIVDAGPILERSHAAEAGLGFESKAANLLHPRFGPWFFLAELLVDLELDPTPTPPAGSCGTCTACIDACPTGAIRAPGEVDARLCISYHTIENRGAVPHAVREQLGPWVFGCDICSEVCPWGAGAPDQAEAYGTHAQVAEGSLIDWLKTPEADFRQRFEGSPLKRPHRRGLARNAALVLAELPSEEGRDALEASLGDPDPEVRAASFWSLTRLEPEPGTARALDAARSRESSAAVADDMLESLERRASPSRTRRGT